MFWFRKRHRPEDAPAVVEAREKRDDAFAALDDAIGEVDRVHDRIINDYQVAEQDRLRRGG